MHHFGKWRLEMRVPLIQSERMSKHHLYCCMIEVSMVLASYLSVRKLYLHFSSLNSQKLKRILCYQACVIEYCVDKISKRTYITMWLKALVIQQKPLSGGDGIVMVSTKQNISIVKKTDEPVLLYSLLRFVASYVSNFVVKTCHPKSLRQEHTELDSF